MRTLGADFTVDYHDPQWAAQVHRWLPGGVDAALAIQPGTPTECLAVVRDGGQVLPVSGDAVSAVRGIRVEMLPYQLDVRDELQQLLADIADGAIRQVVEVMPFEHGAEALERVRTRHARGKIVLTLSRP
jgi:NADPH:quinone reductase-like Zn-dependent oxidoreductase